MTIAIGIRPPQLNGCWKTWQEQDVDNVIKTDMESGTVKTRRRFTGTAKLVTATVILPASLHSVFMQWWRVNQRQGAIATRVKTPYGTDEVFQWMKPPTISWIDKNAFSATVEMWQGAHF